MSSCVKGTHELATWGLDDLAFVLVECYYSSLFDHFGLLVSAEVKRARIRHGSLVTTSGSHLQLVSALVLHSDGVSVKVAAVACTCGMGASGSPDFGERA